MRPIYPQLAENLETTSLTAFIESDLHVMEQKLDGHRWFVRSNGDEPPLVTNRHGQPVSRTVPREIRDFRFSGDADYILDGEFVGGEFWAFDLIARSDGVAGPLTDTSTWPLRDRRLTLESFFEHHPNPFHLVPQAKTREEKIRLAESAITNYAEGLVIKDIRAPYRSAGRTSEWLKLKFVTTADVVVTDVRGDGKESVGYEIYDAETGEPVDIGRASLIGKEKRGAINVGDVLEVRYLYVGADGRLYQPTILRKRDDKLPRECTTQQLKYVNKEVLAL